ncbi:hypothetical protein [Methylobacterium oryzihabitans]|uniref:Uncharacterized protein n=1 Tax=Methylobacterium oryzihabitans TaxID=2499852 RepID=A0A437NT04_9HYPH|nr:hypothetical protein [Methylobacterium oryzihabitans]RVU13159.1 hypothetical protein EOE48_26995 [Methylobacterium oryzihabitans]
MALKKIIPAVALHRPKKDFKPFEYDTLGGVLGGKYSVEVVAPGTPVEIDADEADELIARGLAQEVKTKAEPPAGTAS